MLRAVCGSLAAVLFISAAAAFAADSTNSSKKQDKEHFQATVQKADMQNDKLTVGISDKTGRQTAKTLDLDKSVAVRDMDGKAAKLSDLKSGAVIRITEKDGKVTKIHEENAAVITKVDAKDGTVTVQMKDKAGQNVDRVLHLTEDAEYVDSDGNVATLDVFRAGDTVLFVEEDGKIQGLSKTAGEQTHVTQRPDQSTNAK